MALLRAAETHDLERGPLWSYAFRSVKGAMLESAKPEWVAFAFDDVDELLPVADDNLEDAYALAERLHHLRQAKETLPKDEIAILDLYFGSERTLRSIGDAVGRSVGWVHLKLHEATNHLRERVAA